MDSQSPLTALGFPVPLLGMRPVRLPVFFDDGEILALGKPTGVLVFADPWYPRLPVLIEAIRYQALEAKPEFVRAGIGESGLWAIHDVDPDASGAVIFCRDRDQGERLRNDVGSSLFRFTFEFLTRTQVEAGAVVCDLPVSRHATESRMLVTHKTGKTSQTEFQRLATIGPFQLWSGTTPLPRRHQILIHAFESGLPVVGDELYGGLAPLYLSAIKRGYREKKDREETPMYDGPVYRLSMITLPDERVIEVPPPKAWRGLVRQLMRHA